MAANPPMSKPAMIGIPVDYDLNDKELAILRATRSNSLSTVALAEEVGLGSDPTLVTPILNRLEQLDLLDGYYAAGRVMTSASETHRRYYRLTDRGHLLI